MAYSKSTPNLKLPQYQPTDKPTYLGDFNDAMSKIDTAMGTNKNNAESALNTAQGASQVAEGANTTATSAQTKANQAYTLAQTAKQTADTAQESANTAQNNADNLKNYLKINQFTNIQVNTITTDKGSVNSSNLKIVSNSDNSLGKIYGNIETHNISGITTQTPINLSFQSPIRPTEKISINNAGICRDNTGTVNTIDIDIDPTGKITLHGYVYNGATVSIFSLFPMFYQFVNFND